MPPALRPYNTSDTASTRCFIFALEIRDRPAAPLAELAQICPHQRPLGSRGATMPIVPRGQQWLRPAWCRALGAAALLAPGAGTGAGELLLLPAVNQSSDPQGSGTGRHRGAGTGAGGSTAGWADPRLGQTQGARVRLGYCLTSVAFLCRTQRIVFLRLVLSNTLRPEGVITNSYHVMKTHKSVISHSL